MGKQPHAYRFTWYSFVLWIAVTIFGYMFAGFLHMPGDGPPVSFSLQNLDWSAGLVGFIFGGVTGLVVSLLQWFVLKSWAPDTRSWIPMNVLSFGLVHALADAGVFIPISTFLSLVVGGLIIGLAQSISLRQALSRIYLWVPAALTAWVLAFLWASRWENALVNNPSESILVAYGGAGLITAVITGAAIYFLAAYPANSAESGVNLAKTTGGPV